MKYLNRLLGYLLGWSWSDVDPVADRKAWLAGMDESAQPWTPEREV
jgi:hypothetical protein